MRAVKRRRPMRRAIMQPPDGVDLDEVAERVSYVGSVEHKRYPSFAGQPRPRADATLCDPDLTDPQRLTGWLADGVRAGNIGAPWETDFPRYVWHRVGDIWYEGRLINQELGQYKGYALGQDDDLPGWMGQ